MFESTAFAVAVTVAAVALLVLHSLARRSVPAPDGTAALPPQTDREPSEGSRERAALPNPSAWRWVIVPDLTTAEELLDWAEQKGYWERELQVLGNSTFLVRWRDGADGHD